MPRTTTDVVQVGRELVDRLLSVSIGLDSVRSQVPPGPARDRLAASASELQDALDHVRRLILSCELVEPPEEHPPGPD